MHFRGPTTMAKQPANSLGQLQALVADESPQKHIFSDEASDTSEESILAPRKLQLVGKFCVFRFEKMN